MIFIIAIGVYAILLILLRILCPRGFYRVLRKEIFRFDLMAGVHYDRFDTSSYTQIGGSLHLTNGYGLVSGCILLGPLSFSLSILRADVDPLDPYTWCVDSDALDDFDLVEEGGK